MRLGILGGGQLAKMTVAAAAQLGIETVVWSLTPGLPASQACTLTMVGGLEDPVVQAQMIAASDVITLESEFIPADILLQLQSRGARVLPTPASVAVVQDKWTQKTALSAHHLPVSPGRALPDLASALDAGKELGFPLVIKTRRLGYDGHGTFQVEGQTEVEALFRRLSPPPDLLIAERSIPFIRELSVIVTRRQDGSLVSYPVVETRQPQFVCEEVLAPAPISQTLAARAKTLAEAAAQALNLVGTLAVEMFLAADDSVMINEIAPRPHNSGHFSIEASHTSQFENHVRAVFDLPLGSPEMASSAAVMVNILGQSETTITPLDLAPALAIPGVHVHWYGKDAVRPMRKMGHITALADTVEQAQGQAWKARRALRF